MKRLLLYSLSILLLQSSAAADFSCLGKSVEKDTSKLVEQVQRTYQGVTDLKAQFVQESFFLGLNQRVKSQGTLFFKKPGMMDWRYEDPEPQRFVADGRTLWFYQPKLNQVTLGTFENSFNSGLPVSFLLGVGSLHENFSLEQSCESKKGTILTLQPRTPDPTLDEFLLLVNKERIPIGAKVVDIQGNETEITFNDVNTKAALDEQQFSYKIPRGVDIIDQRVKKPMN